MFLLNARHTRDTSFIDLLTRSPARPLARYELLKRGRCPVNAEGVGVVEIAYFTACFMRPFAATRRRRDYGKARGTGAEYGQRPSRL